LNLACNFRELRHILKQRLSPHAQWEIRQVAQEMLDVCREKWPWLVFDL
jgi:thymidylate synthase ThyX